MAVKKWYNNGVLADGAINSIADALADNLGWLSFVYGRAERLCTVVNGRKFYTPNAFVGGKEYKQLLPDGIRGNYCFFYLSDPQTTELNRTGRQILYTTPFSLVVWVDYRTIEQEYGQRNSERLKMDILNLLNNHVFMRNGTFTINRVYERAENVWQGFTVDETDNQNMMSPFGGFRFEGEIIVKSNCETL